ncbi:hypothetical protein CLF_109415 [Clonorchis sinensis]|uniref:Uncharacterized protein n=1 Tax=Clonorchis sinensis TaxID=79923 RepID=G7YSK7_CLOSI|nr:hypothetical protein CLF_109415 [Clonorchis sinensis]
MTLIINTTEISSSGVRLTGSLFRRVIQLQMTTEIVGLPKLEGYLFKVRISVSKDRLHGCYPVRAPKELISQWHRGLIIGMLIPHVIAISETQQSFSHLGNKHTDYRFFVVTAVILGFTYATAIQLFETAERVHAPYRTPGHWYHGGRVRIFTLSELKKYPFESQTTLFLLVTSHVRLAFRLPSNKLYFLLESSISPYLQRVWSLHSGIKGHGDDHFGGQGKTRLARKLALRKESRTNSISYRSGAPLTVGKRKTLSTLMTERRQVVRQQQSIDSDGELLSEPEM